MVGVNALLVAVYLLWDWAEYSLINGMYQVGIRAYFPWEVQFGGTKPGYDLLMVIDLNWGILLLIVAAVANLYLAFRLQKSKGPL